MEKIVNDIKNYMWDKYAEIKDKDRDERSDIERQFYSKFHSWDVGDCSKVGIIKLFLWYIASEENKDKWLQDEYGKLIDFLNKN